MKVSNVNQPGERSHGIVRGHTGRGRAGSNGIDIENELGTAVDDVTKVVLVGLHANALGRGAAQLVAELGNSSLRVITPAQLVANTNDWAPVDAVSGEAIFSATIIRASTDASRNLTGIVAPDPVVERMVILENVGAFNLVLKHNVTSTAANRFFCPNDADFTLQKDSALVLVYDSTSARWRVLGSAASTSGSGHTIKEAGTPLTARTGLNFGPGFDLADDAGNDETDVAIDLLELTDFTALRQRTVQIGQVIDGGLATLTTGIKQAMLPLPFDCTVLAARVYPDQSGSIQIDILRATHATYQPGTHPVAGDSIIGAGTDIIITTTHKYEDTTLDWDDVTLQKGDVLAISIVSVTSIRKITVALEVQPA